MFRALLRTIPNLSGNVKLACEVTDYIQHEHDTYIGCCRNAHLFPLSSNAYQKRIDVNLLSGNWEYDVSKFYNTYSDIFYNDLFNYSQDSMKYIKDKTNFIKDRNTDFEFGCRRISYEKSNYTLSFYAPIYCEHISEIPEYFKITVKFVVKGQYELTRHCLIPLRGYTPTDINYLFPYLNRYFSKMDDDIIYMKPLENYSVYYGVDVKYGGFNKYKDYVGSKIFDSHLSINDFDKCISEGFKRKNLIMKQILPIAFYFNPTDLLTYDEKEQLKYAEMYITGVYYNESKELPFYNFDDNYTTLYEQYKKFNSETGEFDYFNSGNNIMTITNGLHEGVANNYKYSNKINKEYVRWKLRYTDDKHPYIINNSISFSKNQNNSYTYHSYPQHPTHSTNTALLCNIIDSSVNVLLPIGSNVETHYAEYKYIVDTYAASYNNYISDWFDITDKKDINYIIENTNWSDVHRDGKVMFNGLLYNFNSLYNKYEIKPIDKFAVLFYIDSDNIITNDNRNNLVLTYSSLTHMESNDGNTASGLTLDDSQERYNINSMLYAVGNSYHNYTFDDNDYFIENTNGTGKFIDFNDTGLDYYKTNGYRAVEGTTTYSDTVIVGYEVLPIHHLQNISYIADELLNDDTIYYSSFIMPNSIKPFNKDTFDIDLLNDFELNSDTYILFKQRHFEKYYTTHPNNVNWKNEYVFNPMYSVNDSLVVNNVFSYIGPHNKFYGNDIPMSLPYADDKDILYLDPYNIYENINKFYTLEGTFYINNIVHSARTHVIELKDFYDDTTFVLYISDDEYEEFSESFEIESTYIKLDKYKNNKFLVKKYIRKIHNIYKEEEYIQNNKAFIKINDKTYKIRNIGSDIIKFDYHVIKKSALLYSKNADLIDNVWLDKSNITGSLYVSNIDVEAFTYTIKKWNYVQPTIQPSTSNEYDEEILIKLNSLLEFYQYGVKLGCISVINNKYFINHTGVGTYYNKESYIYKHPQNLITEISGLQFLQLDGHVISKETALFENIEITIFDFDDVANMEMSINNSFVDNNTDPITHKDKGVCLNNITFEIETVEGYGKLMNVDHLNIFKTYMFPKDITEHILEHIYIKKTYLENSIIKHRFISIYDFDNSITFDKIHFIKNYLFVFDGNNGIYELYVKKNYIKISKDIYDSILCLDNDNYNDLYIYKLEQPSDTLAEIPFEIGQATMEYNELPVLYPVFNDVFVQQKTEAVIYQDYLLHYITPVIYHYTEDSYRIFYRYKKADKLMLYDVSEHFNTSYYSFIYDTVREETVTSYYHDENNEYASDEETIQISYYASKIKTYDDYNDFNMKFSYLSSELEQDDFNETHLNTVTVDNVNYGFYLSEINFTNITDVFRLMLINGSPINHFNMINGIDISDKTKLNNMFKQLVPAMRYNILSQLYTISTLVPQHKTSYNRVYTYSNGNIEVNENKLMDYSLYRYFDNIQPIFIQTPNISTEYALKLLSTKHEQNGLSIYKYDTNIYKYDGIHFYNSNGTINKYYQPEYKYFNDNKYINLETELSFRVNKLMTYDEVIEHQKVENIISMFKTYVNTGRTHKFSDDEILFLFNRYNVIYESIPEKVQEQTKKYRLTYKLTLK